MSEQTTIILAILIGALIVCFLLWAAVRASFQQNRSSRIDRRQSIDYTRPASHGTGKEDTKIIWGQPEEIIFGEPISISTVSSDVNDGEKCPTCKKRFTDPANPAWVCPNCKVSFHQQCMSEVNNMVCPNCHYTAD